MNLLGWTSVDSTASIEAVNAKAMFLKGKYPKAEKEIEEARLSLTDSINHPAKF